MIDVSDQIEQALKNAVSDAREFSGRVTDTYPTNWVKLPVIQYVQEDNSTYSKTEREDYSRIRFAFYVWNDKKLFPLLSAIDNNITALGLKRINLNETNDPSGFRHAVVRYEGIIDVNTEMVYLERN